MTRVRPARPRNGCTRTTGRTSIVIDGSDGEILGADGDVRYALRRGPGEVRYFGPGEVPLTHALRNTGERDIRIVVVELLTCPAWRPPSVG